MTKKFNIYFFIGKGGVGKTTCAAAYSIVLAKHGFRTLTVSLDPAHNLGDVFGLKLCEKPVEIMDNLYGFEVDFNKMVQEHLKDLTDRIKDIYGYLKVLNLDRYIDILRHSPGIEEYATLEKISEIIEFNFKKRVYDAIVFDTPPTGLTIRIMALPSISLIWIRKLIELRRAILDRRKFLEDVYGEKLKAKIGNKELTIPSSIEEDPVFKELINIYKKVKSVNDVFTNSETTATIIVVNPELLPVLEARRAYEFLKKINIYVKAIIVNKVLELKDVPEELNIKLVEQNKAIKLINNEFRNIQILKIPLLPEEPTGINNLLKITKYLTPLAKEA